MSQLTEIKPSLLSYKLADTIAVEELNGEISPTLKQNYISLIDQLEIDGIPKEKIATIGKQIIIEKKKHKMTAHGYEQEEITVGSWWRQIAKEKGCTDTKYSSVEVPEPSPQNTSINTKNKKPNIRWIDHLKRTKDVCDLAITKLQECEDFEKILTTKEIEILNHEWTSVLDIATDALDGKTKVPVNTQILLVTEASTMSSITNAGKTYLKVKEYQYNKMGDFITSKQIGHIQHGEIPKYLSLFKPDSRDTAIFQGFFGIPCMKCKSWRVEEKIGNGTNVRCIQCDNRFLAKTISKCKYCQIPLYKEDLLDMITAYEQRVKNGFENDDGQPVEYPCPSCNVQNALPDELIEYAQS